MQICPKRHSLRRWPQGWAEKNLLGLQRLKPHGLYFNRAYTAASQCSPSRAVMTTGRFAPVNRVTRTFLWPSLVHQDRQPNIASLLRDKAGYEVVWKGKWHLSYAANAAIGNGGEDWTAADIAAFEKNYGWTQWNPPDAGNAIVDRQPNGVRGIQWARDFGRRRCQQQWTLCGRCPAGGPGSDSGFR